MTLSSYISKKEVAANVTLSLATFFNGIATVEPRGLVSDPAESITFGQEKLLGKTELSPNIGQVHDGELKARQVFVMCQVSDDEKLKKKGDSAEQSNSRVASESTSESEESKTVAIVKKAPEVVKGAPEVMISFVVPDGSGYCNLAVGSLMVFSEETERAGTNVERRQAEPGGWRVSGLHKRADGKEQGIWIKDSLLPAGLSLILKDGEINASYRDPKISIKEATSEDCKIVATTTIPELKNVKPEKFLFGKKFKPEIAKKIIEFVDEAKKQIPE
jgi:hypothetical protein